MRPFSNLISSTAVIFQRVSELISPKQSQQKDDSTASSRVDQDQGSRDQPPVMSADSTAQLCEDAETDQIFVRSAVSGHDDEDYNPQYNSNYGFNDSDDSLPTFLPANTNTDESPLNFNAIRAQNIANNSEKFRMLFQVEPTKNASDSSTSTADESSRHPEAESDVLLVNPFAVILARQKTFDEELNQLLASCPGREREVKTIVKIIKQFPATSYAPPVIIVGPTGSGKTHVCGQTLSTMSKTMETNCVVVNFNCSSYSSVKECLQALYSSILSAVSAKTSIDLTSLTKDSLQRTTTIDVFDQRLKQLLTRGNLICCLLLDKIDELERADHTLALKLLRLTERTHSSLKIFATLETSYQHISSVIHINFKSYSNVQIAVILNSMAKNQLPSLLTSSFFSANNNRSGRLRLDIMSVLQSFHRVVELALPIILQISRHMGELWSVMLRIWNILAQYSCDQDLGDWTLFRSSSEVNRIAASLLKLPNWNVSLINSERESVDGIKRPRHYDVYEDVSLELDLQSCHALNWAESLPLVMRYLLISAFLVSNNPQNTDAEVFAGDVRQKRRRMNAGNDGVTKESVRLISSDRVFTLERLISIFTLLISCGGMADLGIGSLGQSVTERAFLNIPVNATEEVNRCYGDAELFSSIFTLEAKGLFVRCNGWTLSRPTYIAMVSLDMAQQQADSVGINLNDYMRK